MKKRRKTGRRVVFLIVELFITAILIMYLKQRMEYENIFCKGTIINGEDCSNLTVEEAKELFQEKEEQYNLKIIFKNDEEANVKSAQIEFHIDNLEQKLESIKNQQRRYIYLKGKKYETEKYSFNKDMLRTELSSIEQLQEEYMKDKTQIKYDFNSDKKGFEISTQDVYYLDFEEVLSKISEAIENGETSISLQDLYKIPENEQNLEELNSQISSEISYELPNGEVYQLDANELHLWLVPTEDGRFEKDEDVWNEKLKEFVVNELKPLAETMGKTRKFTPTESENSISIEGGNYGYQLDDELEIQTLKEELITKEKIEREPIYKKVEVADKNDGLGDSYVEIDLTRQKVWVYVKGNLELETDCVTGCLEKGHETPTGIFSLTYKEKNRILRGKKMPDGRYEYESHVGYWMPFNGGIGLHDATWRKTFGGDIYVKNGSHGCINLPYEAAEELYGIINYDMPIIVYKS